MNVTTKGVKKKRARFGLKTRSFGAVDSADACHRPRITGGTDAHSFEADLKESFWGCQVVHSFDEPKMFWQFVRIADKKMPSFTVRRLEQMRFLLIQLTIYFLLNALKTFFIGRVCLCCGNKAISRIRLAISTIHILLFCVSFCPAVIIALLGKQSSPKEQL